MGNGSVNIFKFVIVFIFKSCQIKIFNDYVTLHNYLKYATHIIIVLYSDSPTVIVATQNEDHEFKADSLGLGVATL
jgi:hypothetical protein